MLKITVITALLNRNFTVGGRQMSQADVAGCWQMALIAVDSLWHTLPGAVIAGCCLW